MIKSKQGTNNHNAKSNKKHLIGTGSWRRKGLRIADHRLIEVISRHIFRKPLDFLSLIPSVLPEPYSTKDPAQSINQPRWIAQKMADCLRHMGLIEIVGKNGDSLLYSTSNTGNG